MGVKRRIIAIFIRLLLNLNMTKTIRRVIFYSLCAVFLILTPLVIFYAQGFTFDWRTRQVVKTGGLYLKSTPPKAAIFINGMETKKTPYLFSHLVPQNYDLKIEMDGYYPWEKNLEVKPELVTEARNIFLLSKNPLTELLAKNVTSTIPVFLSSSEEKKKEIQARKTASSSAAWILKDNKIYFISEMNYNLHKTNLTFFPNNQEQISQEPLPEKGNFKILAGPNQNQIAVLSQKNNLYLFNNASRTFELLSSSVIQAQFSDDGKRLLYSSGNEIWVLYLEDILLQPYKKAGEKELITRFAQNISQTLFFPDNEHVAFVAGDQIKVIELDGRGRRNLVDWLTAPAPQIYFDTKNEFFYFLTGNKLFRIKIKTIFLSDIGSSIY